MGKLDAALAWAARGFRVFPLQVDSKDPLDIPWTECATTDPDEIRRLWTDPVIGCETDNNIGFLTTGWVVVDVDTKAGKKGLETFYDLGMDFDTLVNRTPSGGYHLVYRGIEDRVIGQAPLGDGIDIRSHNGYVVAPGSTLAGRDYAVEIDGAVGEFPAHLQDRLKSPRKRTESVKPIVFDETSPEVIELVAYWLQRGAPVAVEGQNGDLTTFQVACRVRDYGVSETYCYELLLDEYNPRCTPPWDADELRQKVENAYRYATGVAGVLAPEGAFGDVGEILSPGPYMNGHKPPAGMWTFGKILEDVLIEKRPWIFGAFLQERAVTALVGPPGAGKSLFELILAAHLACGKSWMGVECFKPGKSLIYNAEDDVKEASRRLNAICDLYELDREIVNQSVSINSSEELELTLVRNTNGNTMENEEHLAPLRAAASDPDVVMVCMDPLVEVHTANEVDPLAMRYVMGVFRSLARTAGVAVLLGVHTAKPPAAKSNSWAGEVHAARGSTAQGGSARIVLTIFGASKEDCEDIGVSANDRRWYVRLDGAKANQAAPERGPRWLKWRSWTRANGEDVGVLMPHDAAETYDAMTHELAEALGDAMMFTGNASLGLMEAVTIVQGLDPLATRESESIIRSRLQRLFASPVACSMGSVQIVRERGTVFFRFREDIEKARILTNAGQV